MGSRDRRVREREQTRTLILNAARDLFVRDGYDAVTMRAVANRIEYTPTAIYHHFRDKTHLVLECCLEDSRMLARRMQHVIRETKDPIERLRKMGIAYAEFGLTNPNHYQLMFMTRLPASELAGLDAVRGNPDEDAYAALKLAVKAAIAAGRLRAEYRDVESTAQLLWATIHGLVSLRIAKQDTRMLDWQDERKAIRLACDTLLHGILCEGSAC